MPRGRKKKKQANNQLNATVMALIVISILLAVLIYSKQGYLGETLSPVLGGVFGYIKYLVPIGLFMMALYIAHEKESRASYSKKLIMFLIVLILIDSVLSCYQVSKGNIDPTKEMDEILSRAYDLGTKNLGGGVIGTLIAALLIRFIGLTGTVIASVGVALILIVLIFGLRPAEAISNSINKMEERREQREKQRI